MNQNEQTLKQRHEKFIETICANEKVYALEGEDGFATSYSNELEDEDCNPLDVLCFWSDKAGANACIHSEWTGYQITEIPLAEFLENWCIGMSNDGLLVGTNFDRNLFGYEVDPLEILLEVLNKLEETNKQIQLSHFESLEALEIQVRNAIEFEEE
jgi:hypothetical protein